MPRDRKGVVRLKTLLSLMIGVVIIGAGIVAGPRLLPGLRYSAQKPIFSDSPFVYRSEEKKECLRLVLGGKANDEIARNKRKVTGEEREKK